MSAKIDEVYYPCVVGKEIYHVHAYVYMEYTDAPEERQYVYVDPFKIVSDDPDSEENLVHLLDKEVLDEIEELGDEIATEMFLGE